MGWGYYGYGDYAPYVPVAEKKAKAVKHAAKLAKKAGREPLPVAILGSKITKTFWGNSWCQNLEAYSDYSNRLPRGRTYAKNGSVVDLEILPGEIKAIVAGSEPYTISISVQNLPADQWKVIKRECAGQIGSLVELLQGKLSQSVMEIVTRKGTGLFPKPKEIKMRCSCPDAAGMCKHLAAVMYGIGARLDLQPELLFKLRKLDHLELIADAGQAPLASEKTTGTKTIAANDLADMFGIEMVESSSTPESKPKTAAKGRKAKPVAVAKLSVADTAPKTSNRKRKSSKVAPTVAVETPAVVAVVATPVKKPRQTTKATTVSKSESKPAVAAKPKRAKPKTSKKSPAAVKLQSLARSAKRDPSTGQ